MNLYRSVGKSYADILVTPRLYENIKAVCSHYSAEALVSERNKLSDEILALMKNDLSEYGLHIISVSIENIDFTDAFTDAVEAKQVATQTLQRAQTEEQQKTMEAQQAAERQKIAAQAQDDVAKIQADAEAYTISAKAEAEANANKEIAESLTPSLIEYVQAQSWDGKLPTTMVGGSDSIPVLTLDTDKDRERTELSNLEGLLSVNCRRQALKVCFGTPVVIVIKIGNKFSFEIYEQAKWFYRF